MMRKSAYSQAVALALLAIALSGCQDSGNEGKENQYSEEESLYSAINSRMSFYSISDLKLKRTAGKYEVSFTISPDKFFPMRSYESEKARFESQLGSRVTGLFQSNEKLSLMSIDVKDAASVSVAREDALADGFSLAEHVEYRPSFLIRLKAMTQRDMKISALDASESLEDSRRRIMITYYPQDLNALGEKSRTDLEVFESNMADIIRAPFELFADADSVYIEARSETPDKRSGTATDLIASYEIDRERFTEITDNWDSLVYKIYDEISYTPVFLADLSTESELLGMDSFSFSMEYMDSYTGMEDMLDVIEADARALVEQMMRTTDEPTVTVGFKAKVPAKEGEKTADGVHQILHDFYTVRATRNVWHDLVPEKLDDKQYLFNFEQAWNPRVFELNIEENLFDEKGYFRAFEFDRGDALITIDTCLFEANRDFSSEIDRAKKREENVGDAVEKVFLDYTKDLIYDIHPPYLESVEWKLEMPFYDTTGKEIDTGDLGSISIDKQLEANYWFQTEREEDLDWVGVGDDNMNLDDDLCQI